MTSPWQMILVTFTLGILFFPSVHAKVVRYSLEISKGSVEVGGRRFEDKLRLNGSIPGPELVFHYGDIAEINVINDTDEKTLIHWHGILLPNDQDGVPYVNSLPIELECGRLTGQILSRV